jgi:hypothetical protein
VFFYLKFFNYDYFSDPNLGDYILDLLSSVFSDTSNNSYPLPLLLPLFYIGFLFLLLSFYCLFKGLLFVYIVNDSYTLFKPVDIFGLLSSLNLLISILGD